MSGPWRILVVDDDPLIAGTVQRVLRPEGYRVDIAHDGQSALDLAAAQRPDLVILDVMMPGLDGIEVCRQLRSRGRMGILMLTAKTGTRDRVQGLDSGADDYLAKPFEYEELLARVRALLRRAAPGLEPEVLDFGGVRLEMESREVRRGDRAISLTAREFQLLEHFMRHPRQVLGREQLLTAVWPDDVTDDNVVAVYISYLRLKLEAAGEPRLVHTVRGFGYALRES